MKSLQIESFLKQVEDMTIFELLKFLRENRRIDNIVLASSNFWTAFLEQNLFDHKSLLLSRGDLHTGEQWKQFFIDLVRGHSYYYMCFYEESTDEIIIGPVYEVRSRHAFYPDNETTILGSLPYPGTPTLHVSFPHTKYTENMFFFGNTKRDLIIRALNWIIFGTEYDWHIHDVETLLFFPSTPLEVKALQVGMDRSVPLKEAFEEIADKLENVDISNLTMKIEAFGINIEEGIFFKGIVPFPEPSEI